MSTDLKAVLRRHERHRRMLRDPDLAGDLLLFALCLDEVSLQYQEQRYKEETGRRRPEPEPNPTFIPEPRRERAQPRPWTHAVTDRRPLRAIARALTGLVRR